MERSCILHIGMHKTGSSSIQETLHENRDKLKEHYGVNTVTSFKNHSQIKILFGKNQSIKDKFVAANLKALEEARRRVTDTDIALKRELSKNTSSRFVISGEGLSWLAYDEVRSLREFLLDYFDHIVVVAYVREPVSYASSAAQQMVQGGATFKYILERSLECNKMNDYAIEQGSVLPHYKYRFDKFMNIFEPKNVHLEIFDRNLLYRNNVVQDFFKKFLGVDISECSLDLVNTNSSLSDKAVRLLEALNKKVPIINDGRSNPSRARGIARAVASLKGPAFQFDDLDYCRYGEIISEDVRWLKATTEGRIDFSQYRIPEYQTGGSKEVLDEALLLNNTLLRSENSRIEMRCYREMWRLSSNKTTSTDRLEAAIKTCRDPKFLRIISRQLKNMGFIESAQLARDIAVHYE